MRENVVVWEEAVQHPPFASTWPGEPVPAISRQIVQSLPTGFESWWPFPGRTHGKAEYLIDPVGYRRLRSWEERERSLPFRAVRGDQPFAEHAMSGQGVTWRCSTSAFPSEAAALIDAIDVDAVRSAFSVAEMDHLGVYKADARAADDDAEFTRVLADLRELSRRYHQLVGARLDLVVTLE
jgi:hypothetical protein